MTSLNPDHAVAGTAGPPLVIFGAGFVETSVIQVDGAPLTTDYVSPKELHATLPSSKLLVAGTLKIAVGTAPPGGGLSAEMAFVVQNPTPQLTQISPQSAGLGAGPVPLTVTGGQFVTGAKISFDGSDLTTTYGGTNSLSATVPASSLTMSGSHAVVVRNPTPGGGASTSIAFIVTNPTVTVSTISPTSVVVGAPQTTLSLTGVGFIPASAVSLNGTTVPSTYVDGAHLTATLPASLFTTTGSFPVVVTNPEPGGGVSTPVTFPVQNPAPAIATIAPTSAPAGAGPTQVTVTGTGFVIGSQVTFAGAPTSTTYVDGAHVLATLSPAQLAQSGTIDVRVVNPQPGGGTSNGATFTVANPAPSITSIAPQSAVVLSPGFTLTINGSGFLAASAAQMGGTSLATTYVSAAQLSATVPSSLLGTAGTQQVIVTNPAPGGGASNAVGFDVGCDTTGVDIPLGALGTVTTRDLLWSSSPPTSERFTASSACPASIPSTPTNSQPYRAYVVQNTAGTPVTLSTWAVCTSTSTTRSDAFLATYRSATVPMTVADRTACTGSVSEGASGAPVPNGLPSPDSNGSTWCPGLTKALGVGMSLAVCERAVVYVQPWNSTSTSYLPPPQIRFSPE